MFANQTAEKRGKQCHYLREDASGVNIRKAIPSVLKMNSAPEGYQYYCSLATILKPVSSVLAEMNSVPEGLLLL